MDIFNLLTSKDQKLFEIVHVKKGQILFHEEEICEKIGIVKNGLIKIISYSLSGMEIIYNEIKTGHLFGNNLLFSSDRRYRGNVIATLDSEVWMINKDNLLILLENNKSFLENYLSLQADFSKTLNFKIKLLSLSSAEERLIYFLKEKQPYRYQSITSLANELYLSRETLSRLVSKMEKEGLILKNGKTLSLPRSKY